MLLAEHVHSLKSGMESPLFFALGNRQQVLLLLRLGANVDYANEFGKTPLFYAIELNNRGLVELLLDHGAQINHPYANAEQLREFECAYDIQHTLRTPLMHAAQHADQAMLELLLKRGADLRAVDGQNHNATNYAVRGDRGANAAYLESRGLAARHETKMAQ
jgi:ankyrin repeat protein